MVIWISFSIAVERTTIDELVLTILKHGGRRRKHSEE